MSVETLMADGDRDDYILMGLAEAQDFANKNNDLKPLFSDGFTDDNEISTTRGGEDIYKKSVASKIAGSLATSRTVSGGVRSEAIPGSDYWLG